MNKRRNPNLSVACLWLFVCLAIGCATTKNSKAENDLTLKGSVVSCGHLNIYQLSEDNKSYIQIIINTKMIELLSENSWDLSSELDGVTVMFRQYDEAVSAGLCNDIPGKRTKPISEIIAREGTLKLLLSESELQNYKNNRRYKVDVRATGLKLNNDKVYKLNIDQATVGWLPG